METMHCIRCGVECERTGTYQKYCRLCAPISYQEMRKKCQLHRQVAKRRRKQGYNRCQPKPDMRGIGECPRWKECVYGAEDENVAFSSGACQYLKITGCCKIVTDANGRTTVEPTKTCRFFHPKETEL